LIGPGFLAFTDDNGVPLPLVNQVAPIVLMNVTPVVTSTGATLNSLVNPKRLAKSVGCYRSTGEFFSRGLAQKSIDHPEP
jgi:hypothetical protein